MALKSAILSATTASDQQMVERQLISFYRYQGNLAEKLQEAEDDGTITFEMQKARAEYYHKKGDLEKATDAYISAFDLAISSSGRDKISDELLRYIFNSEI